MSTQNWITSVMTGIAAAAPTVIGVIPHPWDGVASAFVAFAGALYHLFQEKPL